MARRLRTRGTAALFGIGLIALPTAAPAELSDAPTMALRLNQFRAPVSGNPSGTDMPLYLGFSQNTNIDGDQDSWVLEEDVVSNTASVPRDQWGGQGADEWAAALGVLAGSLNPYPRDESADSYYMWTGLSEGASAFRGDDIGLLKMWFSGMDSYQVPHEPTGRQGALAWRSDPSWATALRGTTQSHTGIVLADGTTVKGPPIRFTRAMYLNHAQAFAKDGDVDATQANVAGPTHEFRQPVPEGTVMNAQLIGYSPSGPWGGSLQLTPDFNTGAASGITGEWRLPVSLTLKKGGFWPEKVQPPNIAAPQYALAITAIGIPLLPEELGPGANEIHFVSNLPPGETFVGMLALHQPDGSVEARRLVIDEPGPRRWTVVDGRLVEERGAGSSEALYKVGGERGPADAGLASADSEISAAAEPEPPPPSTTLAVNEDGRPVALDVVRDGKRLLDSYDVPRILTANGPVELGAHNREGRTALWSNPAGTRARASAAYLAGDVLVIVKIFAETSTFRSYIESHSLSGGPAPHTVEALANLGETQPVDLLTGPVTRATRFLPAELAPRLVTSTGPKQYRLEPLSWDGADVQIRNAGAEPLGEPLEDPELAVRIERNPVWERGVHWPLHTFGGVAPAGPAAGELTAVKTYRMTPFIIDRPVQVGGTPLEETRDFDGYEQIAVGFQARRPDGTPIRQTDVDSLFLSLYRYDGFKLFSGTVTPSFTPDGGTTWGVVLRPNFELDPAEVVIYARASLKGGGIASKEGSPGLGPDQWSFRIDRMPMTASASGGTVAGSAEPRSVVDVQIPELGLSQEVTAGVRGTYEASFDLTAVPGGDYEVLVRGVSPVPAEPERIASGLVNPTTTDAVPDDEEGTATTRLRHLPGGQDETIHREGPPADLEAAVAFLDGTVQGGAYDGTLRATSWAVAALLRAGAPVSGATGAYVDGLAGDGGYAWRQGEPPAATPTWFGVRAASGLGGPAVVDPAGFLRWDGGAQAAPGGEVSSIEATASVILALDATGQLGSLDPWWRMKVSDYLATAQPGSPTESYMRARALALLDRPVGMMPPASKDLDDLAYRTLLGTGSPDALAVYQTHSGGFTLRDKGDRPEAFATALALAAASG